MRLASRGDAAIGPGIEPARRRSSTSSVVTKMKMFSRPHGRGSRCWRPRADGERAIERELHVPGSRGLHAGGRDLLRQLSRRDDRLRQTDVVVRQEHDLQQLAGQRIVVDDLGDVIGELDDQLRLRVARRRLAGENLDPRHPGLVRLGLDGDVECDRLQEIEQLPLVFVDALDLHVEHRIRVDRNPEHALLIHRASATLLARSRSTHAGSHRR